MDIIPIKYVNINWLICPQVVQAFILPIELVSNVSLTVLQVHMQILQLNIAKYDA